MTSIPKPPSGGAPKPKPSTPKPKGPTATDGVAGRARTGQNLPRRNTPAGTRGGNTPAQNAPDPYGVARRSGRHAASRPGENAGAPTGGSNARPGSAPGTGDANTPAEPGTGKQTDGKPDRVKGAASKVRNPAAVIDNLDTESGNVASRAAKTAVKEGKDLAVATKDGVGGQAKKAAVGLGKAATTQDPKEFLSKGAGKALQGADNAVLRTAGSAMDSDKSVKERAQNAGAAGAGAAAGLAAGGLTALTGVGAPAADRVGSAVGHATSSFLGSKNLKRNIALILCAVLISTVGQFMMTVAIPMSITAGLTTSVIGAIEQQEKDKTSCTPDDSGGGGSQAMATAVRGDDIHEQVWNFLIDSGFSPEQAAGVMGNIWQESGFNPFRAEGDSGVPNPNAGWGLVQWTADRHMRIRDVVRADDSLGSDYYVAAPTATAMPKGMGQDQVNKLTLFELQYIVHELRGNEIIAGNDLKKQTTVDGAMESFLSKYERAGDPQPQNRRDAANAYFQYFAKGNKNVDPKFFGKDGPSGGGGTGAGKDEPAGDTEAVTDVPDSPVKGVGDKGMKNAASIVQAAKAKGLPTDAAVLAINASLVYSDLGQDKKKSLLPGGTKGQDAQDAATGWFEGAGDIPGLDGVDGWQKLPPQDAILEASGMDQTPKDTYSSRYKDASKIYEAVADIEVTYAAATTSAGCGGTGGSDSGATEAADAVKKGPNGELVNMDWLTAPSDKTKCPAGTKSVSVDTAYFMGDAEKIRVCEMNGVKDMNGKPVRMNAKAAAAITGFYKEANDAGLGVTINSSYRTHATQQSIYSRGTGNAARPGWSNHEFGMAIDIGGLEGSYNRNNCGSHNNLGECVPASGGAKWKKIAKIAHKYGLFAHDQEFWHFEATPTRYEERTEIPVYASK